VEDDEDDAEAVLRLLSGSGIQIGECRQAATEAEIMAALAARTWDVILADYNLPGFNALKTIEVVAAKAPGTPVVVMSGAIGEEQAVEAMRRGARDYVMKDRLARLPSAVSSAAHDAESRRKELQSRREIERLNEELRGKVAALARSNQDLEHFAHAASHDLREPLRSITSFTQLLLRKFSGLADDEAREYAGYVRDAVERMRGLIDGLLAYSRAEIPPGEEVASASAVAASVVAGFDYTLQELDGGVSVGPLPDVQIHPAILQQVIGNLVGNAIKYRRPEVPPRIRITAEPCGGNRTRFAVADNGIGIGAEHRERIFELFRRLHGSEVPGLGVGLAICKRLVERAGGNLWVESEEGKGSTFYFELPCATGMEIDRTIQGNPKTYYRFVGDKSPGEDTIRPA
jgi:signal transduction histidine kinase